MSEGECGQGFYYDGLVEECQHCFHRCSSPPRVCSKYCSLPSESKAPENLNVRLILVWLFVFMLVFCTLILLLQMLRKKSCRLFLKNKVSKPEGAHQCSDVDGRPDSAEQRKDVDGNSVRSWRRVEVDSQTQCNSSLPVPSTEEGVTILVTTKTVQNFDDYSSYSEYGTEEEETGWWWRSGVV
ncbi:tumor necrosis factor receptor superfamily member 17 [Osmerus mordax]|uniref:tumor necrosis factor receptor superfamily member 17 n=1 Tax=Osmerus mordax TaxID=8014 RepID=UPI00351034BD